MRLAGPVAPSQASTSMWSAASSSPPRHANTLVAGLPGTNACTLTAAALGASASATKCRSFRKKARARLRRRGGGPWSLRNAGHRLFRRVHDDNAAPPSFRPISAPRAGPHSRAPRQAGSRARRRQSAAPDPRVSVRCRGCAPSCWDSCRGFLANGREARPIRAHAHEVREAEKARGRRKARSVRAPSRRWPGKGRKRTQGAIGVAAVDVTAAPRTWPRGNTASTEVPSAAKAPARRAAAANDRRRQENFLLHGAENRRGGLNCRLTRLPCHPAPSQAMAASATRR